MRSQSRRAPTLMQAGNSKGLMFNIVFCIVKGSLATGEFGTFNWCVAGVALAGGAGALDLI